MQPIDQLRRPLRDLRISITDRCNFRCAYCMPADKFGSQFRFLSHHDILRYEEISRLSRISAGLGVRKLRITGGEPLVRPDVDQLLRQLSAIPGVDDIAMTTNGSLLDKAAQKLKDAGLTRVTVSLDSLDNDVFRRMNGNRADVDRVLAGIRAADAAGLTPIKINAVVQKGVNDHTLLDLARFCKDHGYILRFIEYMDTGTSNGWKLDEVVPATQIIEQIDAALPLDKGERSYYGEVALRYRYQDGSGEIGVIASISLPFCGACTRLRLSAEGRIYTCLFAQEGISLRDPMRAGASDEELVALIRHQWEARSDRYSEERSENSQNQQRIEMFYIGG